MKDLQKYLVDKKLGQGAFGLVYLVIGDEEKLALKEMRNMARREREMAEKEAGLCKKLNNKHVIRYVDAFSYETIFCMVMELASGGDLAEKIHEQKQKDEYFSTPFLLVALYQIASGVGHLHENKIMHRDLKPANILVQGEFLDVVYSDPEVLSSILLKVTDFGLARAVEESQDYAKSACGTRVYMAPEAHRGKCQLSCDVWSIGCIFYEMCTFERLFHDINPIFEGDIAFITEKSPYMKKLRKELHDAEANGDQTKSKEIVLKMKEAHSPFKDPVNRLKEISTQVELDLRAKEKEEGGQKKKSEQTFLANGTEVRLIFTNHKEPPKELNGFLGTIIDGPFLYQQRTFQLYFVTIHESYFSKLSADEQEKMAKNGRNNPDGTHTRQVMRENLELTKSPFQSKKDKQVSKEIQKILNPPLRAISVSADPASEQWAELHQLYFGMMIREPKERMPCQYHYEDLGFSQEFPEVHQPLAYYVGALDRITQKPENWTIGMTSTKTKNQKVASRLVVKFKDAEYPLLYKNGKYEFTTVSPHTDKFSVTWRAKVESFNSPPEKLTWTGSCKYDFPIDPSGSKWFKFDKNDPRQLNLNSLLTGDTGHVFGGGCRLGITDYCVHYLIGHKALHRFDFKTLDLVTDYANQGNFGTYNSFLHLACIDGDVSSARHLLNHMKVDVNYDFHTRSVTRCRDQWLDSRGYNVHLYRLTPLYLACRHGKPECVQLLVNRESIDVNQVCDTLVHERSGQNKFWTPLFVACNEGHVECVKTLLQHQDIHPDLAETIVDEKLSGSETLSEGRTSLMVACEKGSSDCVRHLLDHKKNNSDRLENKHDTTSTSMGVIDVNRQIKDGGSALSLAITNGHYECVKLLLTDKDIIVTAGTRPPLCNSCSCGDFRSVQFLLAHADINVNQTGVDGEAPLLIASTRGYSDCVKLLVDHTDVDVNKHGLHPYPVEKQKIAVASGLDVQVKNLNEPWNLAQLNGLNGKVLEKVSDADIQQLNLRLMFQMTVNDFWYIQFDEEKAPNWLQESAFKFPIPEAKLSVCHRVDTKQFPTAVGSQSVLDGNDGLTALYAASAGGHSECVLHLLRHKDIDVNRSVCVPYSFRQKPSPVKVMVKDGYPGVGKFGGFTTDPHTLELLRVEQGSWAEQNTNLKDFIGYRITKINKTEMSTQTELSKFKDRCKLQDSLVFVLEDRRSHDETALHVACSRGHVACVEHLLNHKDIDAHKLDLEYLSETQATITAKKGYGPRGMKNPFPHGFKSTYEKHLGFKLKKVFEGGWADENTNLGDFVGWHITHMTRKDNRKNTKGVQNMEKIGEGKYRTVRMDKTGNLETLFDGITGVSKFPFTGAIDYKRLGGCNQYQEENHDQPVCFILKNRMVRSPFMHYVCGAGHKWMISVNKENIFVVVNSSTGEAYELSHNGPLEDLTSCEYQFTSSVIKTEVQTMTINDGWPGKHVISNAEEGLGIRTVNSELELMHVKDGGWADKNTDFRDFIGWHIIEICSSTSGSYTVENHDDLDEVIRNRLEPGDQVSFIFEHRPVRFVTWKASSTKLKRGSSEPHTLIWVANEKDLFPDPMVWFKPEGNAQEGVVSNIPTVHDLPLDFVDENPTMPYRKTAAYCAFEQGHMDCFWLLFPRFGPPTLGGIDVNKEFVIDQREIKIKCDGGLRNNEKLSGRLHVWGHPALRRTDLWFKSHSEPVSNLLIDEKQVFRPVLTHTGIVGINAQMKNPIIGHYVHPHQSRNSDKYTIGRDEKDVLVVVCGNGPFKGKLLQRGPKPDTTYDYEFSYKLSSGKIRKYKTSCSENLQHWQEGDPVPEKLTWVANDHGVPMAWLKQEERTTAVVTSTEPCSRSFGCEVENATLRLKNIMENSWAARAMSDLRKYIGWHIIKVNSESVKNLQEFGRATNGLKQGDTVSFTLENRQNMKNTVAQKKDLNRPLEIGFDGSYSYFITHLTDVEKLKIMSFADLKERINQQKSVFFSLTVNRGAKTLLHMACQNGDAESVRHLLSHEEIQVNEVDDQGRSPLTIACSNCDHECVRLLVSHKDIDVNKTGKYYWSGLENASTTPLMIVLNTGSMLVQSQSLDSRQAMAIEANRKYSWFLQEFEQENMDQGMREDIAKAVVQQWQLSTLPLEMEVKGIAGKKTEVVVTATKPLSGSFGCYLSPQDLRMKEITLESWAGRATNLKDYFGWCITKVNSEAVKNDVEFSRVIKTLKGAENISFTLKKDRDRPFEFGGFYVNHEDLTVKDISAGESLKSVASLQGFCISKVNGVEISNMDDLKQFKNQCEVGEPLVFILKKKKTGRNEQKSRYGLKINPNPRECLKMLLGHEKLDPNIGFVGSANDKIKNPLSILKPEKFNEDNLDESKDQRSWKQECLMQLLTLKSIDVDDASTALYASCKTGDAKCVKVCLEINEIDVNRVDPEDHLTPLHVSIKECHNECVELLLGHNNIIVNTVVPEPMLHECDTIKPPMHTRKSWYYLNPEWKRAGATPLHSAVTSGTVTFVSDLTWEDIVEAGGLYSSDRAQKKWRNVLENRIDVLKKFFSGPQDLFGPVFPIELKHLNPPLPEEICKSVVRGSNEEWIILDNYFNVESKQSEDNFLLVRKEWIQPVDSLKNLLNYDEIKVNRRNYDGKTVLFVACEQGNIEAFKALLDHKDVDVNAEVFKFRMQDEFPTSNDISRPHRYGKFGETPLYYACCTGRIDFVRLLLAHKDIDVKKEIIPEEYVKTMDFKDGAETKSIFEKIISFIQEQTLQLHDVADTTELDQMLFAFSQKMEILDADTLSASEQKALRSAVVAHNTVKVHTATMFEKAHGLDEQKDSNTGHADKADARFLTQVAAASMFKILDLSLEIIEPGHHKFITPLPSQLRLLYISGVHFSYPSRPDVSILKGVNLVINKAERVAFVGGSGLEKSAVVHLLLRLYDPMKSWGLESLTDPKYNGVITANGIDVKDFAVSAWRGAIGYVGPEPVLTALDTSITKFTHDVWKLQINKNVSTQE